MAKRIVFLLLAVFCAFQSVPKVAAGNLQTVSEKVGYFSLAQVRQYFPEAKVAENMRTLAENQLKDAVNEGNRNLAEASKVKSKAEIEAMAKQLQSDVNAKQQALVQLLQTSIQAVNTKIATAVASIAKAKGLNIVVDSGGVFKGLEEVQRNGPDLTGAILSNLGVSGGPASREIAANPISLRMGYFNKASVESGKPSGSLNQAIKSAVEQEASRLSINFVMDGASVFAGGQVIVANAPDLTNDVKNAVSQIASSAPATVAAPAPAERTQAAAVPDDAVQQSFKLLINGDNNAAADMASAAVRASGCSNEAGMFGVIVAYCAYTKSNRSDLASTTLADAGRRCNTGSWPYPIIRYLKKEISEQDLISQARDEGMQIDAKTFIAINAAAAADFDAARSNMEWVQGHAPSGSPYQDLARAELARLPGR